MIKYNGETIAKVLMEIPDALKQQAESYLNSDRVRSVKYRRDKLEPNEFEAFIVENSTTVLIPGVEVNELLRIQNIHCQCDHGENFCIHTVALLMASQFMIEEGCMDYHSAQKAIMLQSLESGMLQ